MKQSNFGRKKRQLKVLVEKLQHLVRHHRVEASAQIEKLIQKIKRLAQELSGVLSHATLKKILGVAAVLIGISFSANVNAQQFDEPVPLPFGLKHTYHFALPASADIDGDGDPDLLVGEYGAFKYFQNTGTALNPHFAAPVKNPFGLVSSDDSFIPSFADLDGDGDLDLLVGGFTDTLNYFQNTGSVSNPHFASPVANPFDLDPTSDVNIPAFADLDDDGDMDLLVGDYDSAMEYFQNTGSNSNPQFEAPLVNPFGLVSTHLAFPTLADLDHDGDMDLLVGEYNGTMQYFKNTGSALNPQFASPIENPFGLVSVDVYAMPAFADLDGDGDTDLLVGEYYGVMQYFENLEIIIGIADLSQSLNLKLYPNPVDNLLHIDSEEDIIKIEVFNILGLNVITTENQVSQVSLQHLSPGTYMVKVTSASGQFITKKIQKQ